MVATSTNPSVRCPKCGEKAPRYQSAECSACIKAKLSLIARPQPITRPSDRHHAHQWTESERDLIRTQYDGTWQSAERLANIIGVSYNAVKGQVSKLGAAKLKHVDWSPHEISLLTEWSSRISAQAMQRRLRVMGYRRSLTAVMVKLKRLHLQQRFRDGWYTSQEASDLLGVDAHWLRRRIDSGALRASYHHLKPPGENGMRAWHIEAAHLRDFVIRYPEELRGRNVDLPCLVHLLIDEQPGRKPEEK